MPNNQTSDQRSAMFIQPLSEKRYPRHSVHSLDELATYARLSEQSREQLKTDRTTYERYLIGRSGMYDLEPVAAPSIHFDHEPLGIALYLYEGKPAETSDYAVHRWNGLIFDLIGRLAQMNFEPKIHLVTSVVSAVEPAVHQLFATIKEFGQPLDWVVLSNLLMSGRVSRELSVSHFNKYGNGWNEDFFNDFKLAQSDLQITIPSIYYRKNFQRKTSAEWAGCDLDWFFSHLQLDFLYDL
ncbi:MAG: hypothetical protein INR73_28415 [Williamsia sp.]|nr:hypothetical protein [Williamsia sp.]